MTRSILMFCPQFRPCIGGAERQAEKLAAALVALGCRVTIVTPRIDPDSPAREMTNGVVVERFPLSDLASRFPLPGIALLNVPWILCQIAGAVRSRLNGADVLHCHIASLQTVAAALGARLKRVPVLCKAAIAADRSDLGEIEKGGSSGSLVAWMARKLIGTWVATTAAVEQALIRAGVEPTRIVRIPNGVELPEHRKGRAVSPVVRRFLYLGRLSTNIQRDVPSLVAAFDRLARDRADVELAIVGAGDLFEQTTRLVNTCAARDRIRIPGFDQPEKWLAWADCFILPSRSEGLSNALLEAMAAGLPCIANDIPANREVLDGGAAGVLVPVGDEERLHVAMRRMAGDADHAAAMRAAALTRVRSHYGITSIAARYIALYQALLGNSGR